jgi:hypothetical protein
MIPSLSLFQLELARMRNAVTRYRNDPKQLRKPLMIAAAIIFYLYLNVFRHIITHKAGVITDWHWVRYAFPIVLAWFAAVWGGWGRMNRWLVRWASGSWSVLPVEPRPISEWLTGTMLLMDSGWIALGIAISIGLRVILPISWWHEFPFLLLGTALLVSAAAVAKMFAILILRLTGKRILQWPNWILRALGAALAMVLVQPLIGFWLLAEYQQQHEAMGFALAILLILAAVVTGLAFLARILVVREWPEIAASFEMQQTQRREKSDLLLADLIVRPMRSPISRLVSLYNLRSGNMANRWGQQVNLGGRRLYMFIIMFVLVGFMLVAFSFVAMTDKSPIPSAVASGVFSSMFVLSMLPPVLPMFKLLRILPVTFHEWLWSLAVLPVMTAIILLCTASALVAINVPESAYLSYGIMWGIFLGIVPMSLLVTSAFPNAMQTGQFIVMGVLALGVLLYFVTWMAIPPWIIAADIYFYRKAAREWRGREEGLSV